MSVDNPNSPRRPFYAHSLAGPMAEWERLEWHLRRTGALARRFARPFGLGALGAASGLLHDIGKYSDAFQRYIAGRGPSTDHSTAGAQAARECFGPVAGLILAYGIAGHHAGLPDGGETQDSDLGCRLLKTLEPSWRCWSGQGPRGVTLPPRAQLIAALRKVVADDAIEADPYRAAFLIRMNFSALVDADFLATEWFYDRRKGLVRRRKRPRIADLMPHLDASLHAMAAAAKATPINRWRAEILARCRQAAPLPPGVFTLDVPTGGGKTLSSLAFAFDHAVVHGLERVVYAIPYTSIIEQTADVFRRALSGAGDDVVLEHHSAAEIAPSKADEPIGPERLHLATENWDAPVVVTTTVQLFESLHANRPSRCRKLHNLARSVIVLDEAQALPVERLAACVATLKMLVQDCGATVLLCSATLPGLDRAGGLRVRLPRATPLIPDGVAAEMAKAFHRVRVRDMGPVDDATLTGLIAAEHQVLTIVDSRAHAQDLFDGLPADGSRFHLSAAMCPDHRRTILATVKARLDDGAPCRLIATRVIEAGVDLSFPTVWRAIAGIDSIAQAAGRCNRHGEGSGLGDVGIFRPTRPDAIPPKLADLRRRASLGAEVLRYHPDPLSAAAIATYFERLFTLDTDQDKDRCWSDIAKAPGLDWLPFRTVAETFRMIEDGGTPVIVAFDAIAKGLIADLATALASAARPRRLPLDLLRKLQAYTVSVHGRDRLIVAGGAVPLDPLNDPECRFVVLTDGPVYDKDLGFRPSLAGVRDAESNLL